MNALRAISIEYKMNILESLSYRVGMISDLLVYGVLQVILYFLKAGSSLADFYHYQNSRELLLIGYIAWVLSCSCISNIGGEVRDEMRTGTFYQKINAVVSVPVLYVGKFLASVTMQLITIAELILVSTIFFNVEVHFSFAVIATIFLCLLGMYGIGLFFGGLTVYFKQISSIIYVTQIALLFISNVLTENSFTSVIFKVVPLTYCNDLIRRLLSGDTVAVNEYIVYIMICIAFLFFGMFFLNFMIRKSKKRGNLLQY